MPRPLTPYDGLNGLDFLLASLLVVGRWVLVEDGTGRYSAWSADCESELTGADHG